MEVFNLNLSTLTMILCMKYKWNFHAKQYIELLYTYLVHMELSFFIFLVLHCGGSRISQTGCVNPKGEGANLFLGTFFF